MSATSVEYDKEKIYTILYYILFCIISFGIYYKLNPYTILGIVLGFLVIPILISMLNANFE